MRFKDYFILTEDPDDLYVQSNDSRTFGFCGNLIMYFEDNGVATHRDMLCLAKKRIFGLTLTELCKSPVTMEEFRRHDKRYCQTGVASDEVRNYLRNSIAYIGRSSFINNVDGAFLGRISLATDVISFWNSADSFSPADKRNVTNIIKIYGKNPKNMTYTFVNHDKPETNMSYEQFYNITQSATPVKQADTSHIVHNLSPDKKKAALLQMGAKPKAAKGVEARYLQGESFKEFLQTVSESPDITIKRFPDQETGYPIGFPESDARTFIVADDFICVAKQHNMFHEKMYDPIREVFNYNNQKAKQQFIMHGIPSVTFLSQIGNDVTRPSLIQKFPNWIQGRIWLEHKYVSFWNHGINVRNNLKNIELMIRMLGDDPENFTWEIDNKKVLSFAEVKNTPNIDGELPDTHTDNSWQQQLHTLPPEKKGNALKAMGIKPKAPMGAAQRYAMGESFKHFFQQMFTENPDRIRDRENPDNWIIYDKNNESYTVLLFTDEEPGTFAIRKDSPKNGGAGHGNMRGLLRRIFRKDLDSSDNINDIKSDVPVDEIALKNNNRGSYEVRIWTHNKIISCWSEWQPNLVQAILKLFRFMNQNPQEYIFEFDRSYYDPREADSPGCYTYDEFSTGQKDHSPEALRLKQERLEDRKILAQAKLGMMNKDKALKHTDVKIPNLGKAPSFYKNSGD